MFCAWHLAIVACGSGRSKVSLCPFVSLQPILFLYDIRHMCTVQLIVTC